MRERERERGCACVCLFAIGGVYSIVEVFINDNRLAYFQF